MGCAGEEVQFVEDELVVVLREIKLSIATLTIIVIVFKVVDFI